MTIGDVPERSTGGGRHGVAILPTTRLGRWAVSLGAAFLPLTMAWSVVPLGAVAGFVCGMAGSIVGLVAITRHRERALTVFLAAVPGALVLLFVVAELTIGHE